MTVTSIINNRTQATRGVFMVTAIFILWEYFNGGVISHHLLAREDLPGMSNCVGTINGTTSILDFNFFNTSTQRQ